MNDALHDALGTVLGELLDGSAEDSGWVLNPRDPGLLRALAAVSAAEASVVPPGGRSSIAAHIDHLQYGLSLMNRWSQGEQPFASADWTASWTRIAVSEREWAALREHFAVEARKWLEAIRTPRVLSDDELKGWIASVAHLAYHLGAMRQIGAALRGPQDASRA